MIKVFSYCVRRLCLVLDMKSLVYLLCEYYNFLFQAEDGIRDLERSRGLGELYKRQVLWGEGGGVARVVDVVGDAGLRVVGAAGARPLASAGEVAGAGVHATALKHR